MRPVFSMFHSARTVVAAVCLLLLVLPLLLLGIAYAYESTLLRSIRRDLLDLSGQARTIEAPQLQQFARRGKVLAYLLAADGSVRADSGTGREGMDASLLGTITERLVSGLWPAPQVRELDAIERELGPIGRRPEVAQAVRGKPAFAVGLAPSGQAVVVHLATPLPDGRVLYLARGSRRGLRQLLLVRHEFLKLIVYEGVFAVLLIAFLSRHLLYPLEWMARAARRYPQEPLDDARLLARRDELGQLARAIHTLAENLEARRRNTAELGADVAHEFKNPLATIAASVDLLGNGAVGVSPERVRMVVEHIEEAVGRLHHSLDALLSLLRLEATLNEEKLEPVDYAELLQEVLEDYRRDPRYAHYALRGECAADVGQVRMLALRWEELLRNLLDNALVQPMARREVVVRVVREGDIILTTVRDFGPGVSLGNRDKIFRRFFSQRPAGAPPGTGLGLSIVQAVVTAHGGRVEVREPDDGPGALFVLTMRA